MLTLKDCIKKYPEYPFALVTIPEKIPLYLCETIEECKECYREYWNFSSLTVAIVDVREAVFYGRL